MDAVGVPFANNITPNSAPYITGSYFASSRYNVSGRTAGGNPLQPRSGDDYCTTVLLDVRALKPPCARDYSCGRGCLSE